MVLGDEELTISENGKEINRKCKETEEDEAKDRSCGKEDEEEELKRK